MKEKPSPWEEYRKVPRYVVGLQSGDVTCFKDIHECSQLSEAKEVAEKQAKSGLAVIIYDRREYAIIHKIQAEPKKEKPKPIEPEVPSCPVPKKVKRK